MQYYILYEPCVLSIKFSRIYIYIYSIPYRTQSNKNLIKVNAANLSAVRLSGMIINAISPIFSLLHGMPIKTYTYKFNAINIFLMTVQIRMDLNCHNNHS